MREIKCRIWQTCWGDVELQIMHPVTSIDFEKKVYFVSTSSAGYYFKDAVLMLYTGQETNDGKEIYDGDIIFGRDSEGYGPEAIHYTIRSVVSWDEECGKWVVTEIGGEEKYDLYDYSLIDGIAGNIHQHPELLKTFLK